LLHASFIAFAACHAVFFRRRDDIYAADSRDGAARRQRLRRAAAAMPLRLPRIQLSPLFMSPAPLFFVFAASYMPRFRLHAYAFAAAFAIFAAFAAMLPLSRCLAAAACSSAIFAGFISASIVYDISSSVSSR